MTVLMLDLDELPTDVALGHTLEMMGKIPHDEVAASQMGNDLCRWHLRLAEAFAAGLKAGREVCDEVE